MTWKRSCLHQLPLKKCRKQKTLKGRNQAFTSLLLCTIKTISRPSDVTYLEVTHLNCIWQYTWSAKQKPCTGQCIRSLRSRILIQTTAWIYFWNYQSSSEHLCQLQKEKLSVKLLIYLKKNYVNMDGKHVQMAFYLAQTIFAGSPVCRAKHFHWAGWTWNHSMDTPQWRVQLLGVSRE